MDFDSPATSSRRTLQHGNYRRLFAAHTGFSMRKPGFRAVAGVGPQPQMETANVPMRSVQAAVSILDCRANCHARIRLRLASPWLLVSNNDSNPAFSTTSQMETLAPILPSIPAVPGRLHVTVEGRGSETPRSPQRPSSRIRSSPPSTHTANIRGGWRSIGLVALRAEPAALTNAGRSFDFGNNAKLYTGPTLP